MAGAKFSNDDLILRQNVEINCDEYFSCTVFLVTVIEVDVKKLNRSLYAIVMTPPELPEGWNWLKCNSDTAGPVVLFFAPILSCRDAILATRNEQLPLTTSHRKVQSRYRSDSETMILVF